MKTLRMTLLVFSAMVWGSAWAVPGLINYQGRLTDSGGSPITAATNVTFTFWDAETGGTQLGGGFSDMDTVTPDSNGIYSTDIGDDPGDLIPASVFAGDSVWLNVNVGGEDLVPRLRIDSAGFAVHAATADSATTALSADTATTASNSLALQGLPPSAFLNMSSDAYVVVKTTSDPVQNGASLLAAYGEAKALTPNGAALSATNRAAVLVPPGNYDLGSGELTLDTEFVDVVGLSTARDDQYIYGTSNGAGTGVIRQTANDVRIENLLVQCTATSGSPNYINTDPSAYYPDSNLPATVIRNCEFQDDGLFHSWSMRILITYSGTYTDCKGGDQSFGGYGGAASGTFTDCTGGQYAFAGDGGTASGTFTDCTGGDYAFCGYGVTASGTFTHCTGGIWSFASLGTASGTFTDCTAGNNSFGYNHAASGTFTDCTGGTGSFGGGTLSSSAGAQLFDCRMTGSSWPGTFTGRMQGCHWGTGITLGAAARIYDSTFLGNVNLNGTAAGIINSYIKGSITNDTGPASFNQNNLEDGTNVN